MRFLSMQTMQKIRAKHKFYFKESITDNQGRLDNKNAKIQK